MKVINRTRQRLYYNRIFYYKYIKNNYRLIEVDLSKQKELDADPKATQQIEFVG